MSLIRNVSIKCLVKVKIPVFSYFWSYRKPCSPVATYESFPRVMERGGDSFLTTPTFTPTLELVLRVPCRSWPNGTSTKMLRVFCCDCFGFVDGGDPPFYRRRNTSVNMFWNPCLNGPIFFEEKKTSIANMFHYLEENIGPFGQEIEEVANKIRSLPSMIRGGGLK